jgi:hypothetical protein
MKMEQIECSETLAYKIQTPGNHPEENIKQQIIYYLFWLLFFPCENNRRGLVFLPRLSDFVNKTRGKICYIFICFTRSQQSFFFAHTIPYPQHSIAINLYLHTRWADMENTLTCSNKRSGLAL